MRRVPELLSYPLMAVKVLSKRSLRVRVNEISQHCIMVYKWEAKALAGDRIKYVLDDIVFLSNKLIRLFLNVGNAAAKSVTRVPELLHCARGVSVMFSRRKGTGGCAPIYPR